MVLRSKVNGKRAGEQTGWKEVDPGRHKVLSGVVMKDDQLWFGCEVVVRVVRHGMLRV